MVGARPLLHLLHLLHLRHLLQSSGELGLLDHLERNLQTCGELQQPAGTEVGEGGKGAGRAWRGVAPGRSGLRGGFTCQVKNPRASTLNAMCA